MMVSHNTALGLQCEIRPCRLETLVINSNVDLGVISVGPILGEQETGPVSFRVETCKLYSIQLRLVAFLCL